MNNVQDLVNLIGAYFRLMPPTYQLDKFGDRGIDESEIIHKDYFPVITSIKHLPRRGP